MESEPIKGASVAESTARHLKDLILEGALSPGDLLLPERDLAVQLNVSRPTLRQGIKILEDEGLLVSTPAGRSVASLGREITDPLIALIASHAEVVDDYLEFRATTERMAARLAAGLAEIPGVRLAWPVQGNEVFPILPAGLDAALGHDLEHVGVEGELRVRPVPAPGQGIQADGAPDGDVAHHGDRLIVALVALSAEKSPEDHVVRPC